MAPLGALRRLPEDLGSPQLVEHVAYFQCQRPRGCAGGKLPQLQSALPGPRLAHHLAKEAAQLPDHVCGRALSCDVPQDECQQELQDEMEGCQMALEHVSSGAMGSLSSSRFLGFLDSFRQQLQQLRREHFLLPHLHELGVGHRAEEQVQETEGAHVTGLPPAPAPVPGPGLSRGHAVQIASPHHIDHLRQAHLFGSHGQRCSIDHRLQELAQHAARVFNRPPPQ
mmetsp:Transcript_28446/g.79531  ORF Transcript_28446/g.79531 Transcript_28446/m.79531 type:complete len:225 (+) Transcript_28446:2610-3284(+)